LSDAPEPARPRAAMILAAGRGERMRPLTATTPKPLLRVRGEPLIERPIRACARAGITHLVVNLSWLGSQIRAHLGDGARFGVAIEYSEELPDPLETAGGIVRALPLLGAGPFAVLNADVYTDYPLERLRIAAHDDVHLVLVPNPVQHPRGDFGHADGRALADASERFTFSGIGLYRAALFADCPDGVRPLKPLLVRAMESGRCGAEVYTGLWEDVGTPERLAALNRGCDGGVAV
jgi:MurNAc alpha-1-phosphate uridylyltransferase